MSKLTKKQMEVAVQLFKLLDEATDEGVLDLVADAAPGPDVVNEFCEALDRAMGKDDPCSIIVTGEITTLFTFSFYHDIHEFKALTEEEQRKLVANELHVEGRVSEGQIDLSDLLAVANQAPRVSKILTVKRGIE